MSRYRNRKTVRVIEGRPDLYGDPDFGVTFAKRFPPYVFSTRGGALVHKVKALRLRWVEPQKETGGENLVWLAEPFMTAECVCGVFFYFEAARARTCLVPAPDAMLCGACHGEVRPFSKEGWARKAGITKRAASVKLGCAVQGY